MINLLDHVSVDKVTDLIHQPVSVLFVQQTQDQVDYFQDVFVIQDTLGVQPYKDASMLYVQLTLLLMKMVYVYVPMDFIYKMDYVNQLQLAQLDLHGIHPD